MQAISDGGRLPTENQNKMIIHFNIGFERHCSLTSGGVFSMSLPSFRRMPVWIWVHKKILPDCYYMIWMPHRKTCGNAIRAMK